MGAGHHPAALGGSLVGWVNSQHIGPQVPCSRHLQGVLGGQLPCQTLDTHGNPVVRSEFKFCLCHLPVWSSLAYLLISLSLYRFIYKMRFEYLSQRIICPRGLEQSFTPVTSEAAVCKWCFSRTGTMVLFVSGSDPLSHVKHPDTKPIPVLRPGWWGS